MKYSDEHRVMRERAWREKQDRDAHSLNPMLEIRPRIIGMDTGPVSGVLPFGGTLFLTGSLTVLFGAVAYGYARKHDWKRATVSALLCAGSAWLTYWIFLNFLPSDRESEDRDYD